MKLQETAPSKRKSLLVEHICRQVALVLGINNPESISSMTGFFELGMDSLTSVELRNKLQTSLKCSVSSTITFNYSTIDKLVDYLAQQLNLTDDSDDPQKQLSQLSEVTKLSEDELEASVIQEIEELEKLI
ncbi:MULTISPECIES: acyl carrier protein [unclassified Okeania]|uniref:acyl carrier protein n=1 Tax=unclassified Okeania TaxID=2634635 RepID=UPI002579C0E6|nr:MULTISPECIES: acyl carrier protein [unclassified Okeania]